MNSSYKFLIYVFLFSVGLVACKRAENTSSTGGSSASESTELRGQSGVSDDVSEKNILQIAVASDDHTTLVTAVQAAGAQDALANAGPLTVFAPTNEAFAALPKGTLEELTKPENKAKLSNIIIYHAAPGSYDENNIKGVMGIGQANGDKVKVEVKDGVTYVNDAKVIGTVKASNGYIHIIDKVLLPPEK